MPVSTRRWSALEAREKPEARRRSAALDPSGFLSPHSVAGDSTHAQRVGDDVVAPAGAMTAPDSAASGAATSASAVGASGYVPTMVPSFTRSGAPSVMVKLPLSR